MVSYALREYWNGVSPDEIGASMPTKHTAEQVEAMIEKERKAIQEDALNGIVKRAKDGDVAAVDWLEAWGLITIPVSRGEDAEP